MPNPLTVTKKAQPTVALLYSYLKSKLYPSYFFFAGAAAAPAFGRLAP
jgi:hypothetical protein